MRRDWHSAFAAAFPENTERRRALQALRLWAQQQGPISSLGRALQRYAPRLSAHGDLSDRRIAIFGMQFPWLEFTTAIAIALAARGAKMTVAWLPYFSTMPAPAVGGGLEALMAARLKMLFPTEGPIVGADLCSYSRAPIDAKTNEELKRVARFDTHKLTRRENISLEIDGAERALFDFRFTRLQEAYATARAFLEQGEFDAAVIPNGSILEFAAFQLACRDVGVDSSSFEFWERHATCVWNLDRNCFDRFEQDIWPLVPKVFDAGVRERVSQNMATREGVAWDDFLIKYQTAPVGPVSLLREKLQLDDRPIILVLPNVPYDSAILGIPSGFRTMGDWFLRTLRVLAEETKCQVVIRAHPAERVLIAEETAGELVARDFPKLPSHFRFVANDAKINTYALMRMACLGLVHTSTTGLELAMRGVPTLVAAEVHYANKGFTSLVSSEEEIRKSVRSQIASPSKLSQTQIELAWIYADMFMNGWPRPFAFRLADDFWQTNSDALERCVTKTLSRNEDDTFTLLSAGPRARKLREQLFRNRK